MHTVKVYPRRLSDSCGVVTWDRKRGETILNRRSLGDDKGRFVWKVYVRKEWYAGF
jgi:hypothetical protein